MKTHNLTFGKLSFALALIALLVPFLVSILFESFRDFFWTNGPYFILVGEFFALVLGIISWRTLPGKMGTILSIVVTIMFFLYFTFV